MKHFFLHRAMLMACLQFSLTMIAQDNRVLTGLTELQAFTSISGKIDVNDLTLIEPEGGVAIPESEVMKLADRVGRITGTLTLQGLTELTTTVGVIDQIDCDEAGFVFKDCPELVDMNAFAQDGNFSVIKGDFIVENCPKVATGAANAYVDKSFSNIKEVRGNLKLINLASAMNKPEKLFPHLERVEGDFVIDGCLRLYYFTNTANTADMPLNYVGGNIEIRNNPSFQRLNGLGTLKYIGGNVTILDNGAIPNGSTDDAIMGFCKIKYYELAGILNGNATVQLGRTGNLLTFSSLSPCPYEIVEDVNGTFMATPANKFLASIGVNSAINSRGENVNTTKEIMQYIGACWIRTNMGGNVSGGTALKETTASGAGNSIGTYKQLYEEAGIKFSAGLGAGGVETNIPILIDNVKRVIAATSPDILIAIEGNNEPNNGNWYVIYEGEIGGGNAEGKYNWKPVARMQRDLYQAVKNDPVLGTAGQNYPVWHLTYGGASGENVGVQYLKVPEDDLDVVEEFRGVTFSDVANLHNYFDHPGFKALQNNQTWRAAEPGMNIPPGVDVLYRHHGVTWLNKYKGYRTEEELTALPRVTTETGATITGELTEEIQALMYMSIYLSQFKRGFDYTAMYLLTDRRDESGNQSFGFYDKYYNPRKAAHYLHNLTTILKDDESIETPEELSYSITGRTITVHDLLLQKKDGTFELVIWGEKYRGGSDKITVGFDKIYDEVWVYNPTKGINPERILHNISSLELEVSNHPYVIEIGKHPDLSGIVSNHMGEVQVSVFPNPVVDKLTMHSERCDMAKIVLRDLFGKLIFQQTNLCREYFLEMGHLPKGVYLLSVWDTDNNAQHQKIIKM